MKAPERPRHDREVAATIKDARSQAAAAQRVVDEASAARLAELKRQDPRVVARLPYATELTATDAEDLRHWLGDHMKPGRPAGRRRRGGPSRWMKAWRRPWVKPALVGIVVLGAALGLAIVRTPERYRVLETERSMRIMRADGSAETLQLPKGLVLIADGDNPDGSTPVRYWIDRVGYRTVTVKPNK